MDKLFTRQSHSVEYSLEILQQIHPQFQTVLLDPLRPSVEKLSIVFVEHKIWLQIKSSTKNIGNKTYIYWKSFAPRENVYTGSFPPNSFIFTMAEKFASKLYPGKNFSGKYENILKYLKILRQVERNQKIAWPLKYSPCEGTRTKWRFRVKKCQSYSEMK